MKASRRLQIETLITERKSITMQELCELLSVSMNTVRNDVSSLVKDGVVEKVYGGIVLKDHSDIPIYERRSQQQVDVKDRIAQAAERIIADGDIVFIDSGTTTKRIMECLDPQKHITVVTANVAVLQVAHSMSNVTVMMLPGMYNPRYNSLLDSSTIDYLTRFRHTKAFLGVSSFSAEGALNVSNWQEYELKRTAIAHSSKVYLMADSTKCGNTGLLSFGTVDQMTGVYTDKNIPESFLRICKEKKVAVTTV